MVRVPRQSQHFYEATVPPLGTTPLLSAVGSGISRAQRFTRRRPFLWMRVLAICVKLKSFSLTPPCPSLSLSISFALSMSQSLPLLSFLPHTANGERTRCLSHIAELHRSKLWTAQELRHAQPLGAARDAHLCLAQCRYLWCSASAGFQLASAGQSHAWTVLQ